MFLLAVGCAKQPAEPQAEGPTPTGAESDAPADGAAAQDETDPPVPEPGSIQEQYAAFVAERNACASDAECVLVSPGCPLGCGTGVRPEHAEAVSKKATALIAEAEQGGAACTYKCAFLVPKCTDGRCAAVQEAAVQE